MRTPESTRKGLALALALAGAALLTWLLLVVVAGTATWAGLLLLPYAVWLSVATALAVAYAWSA